MLKLLFIIAFTVASAAAFNINSSSQNLPSTRRDVLKQTGFAFLAISIAGATPANADIIRSPGKCANGEGDGCDILSEENEFIKRLQEKSSENRVANQRESLNAFYMKNYPGVFDVDGKKMVMNVDGSFALYSSEEVSKMTSEGKIKIEYPMSKGGRIADMTQKPALVMTEWLRIGMRMKVSAFPNYAIEIQASFKFPMVDIQHHVCWLHQMIENKSDWEWYANLLDEKLYWGWIIYVLRLDTKKHNKTATWNDD